MVIPWAKKWTCWEKAHRYYIPNHLFNIKGAMNKNVRNQDKTITFNMMSRPFICRKKSLSDSFYKHAVGTKSNKILKRAFANKETVKDLMIDRKKNDAFEFDDI